MSAENNTLRSDRRIYQDKLSYLWGYVRTVLEAAGPNGKLAMKHISLGISIRNNWVDVNGVLDSRAVRRGSEDARKSVHNVEFVSSTDVHRARVAENKYSRLLEELKLNAPSLARHSVVEHQCLWVLAKRYGYADPGEVRKQLRDNSPFGRVREQAKRNAAYRAGWRDALKRRAEEG